MKNQLHIPKLTASKLRLSMSSGIARGGDPSYRCGGCTELWNSIDSSPKYKFITERLTIAEAKQRGLLIGDLPCIYDEATGKCEHIGYYMGGIGGYEVIHSSQTRQWVAATQLKNGFTHILRHRLIRGVSPSAVNDTTTKMKAR